MKRSFSDFLISWCGASPYPRLYPLSHNSLASLPHLHAYETINSYQKLCEASFTIWRKGLQPREEFLVSLYLYVSICGMCPLLNQLPDAWCLVFQHPVVPAITASFTCLKKYCSKLISIRNLIPEIFERHENFPVCLITQIIYIKNMYSSHREWNYYFILRSQRRKTLCWGTMLHFHAFKELP